MAALILMNREEPRNFFKRDPNWVQGVDCKKKPEKLNKIQSISFVLLKIEGKSVWLMAVNDSYIEESLVLNNVNAKQHYAEPSLKK